MRALVNVDIVALAAEGQERCDGCDIYSISIVFNLRNQPSVKMLREFSHGTRNSDGI
jgi:hypothetical protein